MPKKILWLILFLILAAGGWVGWTGYRDWRQTRLMEQARQSIAQSDYRNATLSLQQLLLRDPSHQSACALMAELAESFGSTNALYWRNRLIELNPAALEPRLDFARSALKLKDAAAAWRTLQSIAPPHQQSAEYLKVAAAAAWAMGDVTNAAHHYEEALRLEPTNLVSQLNLATIHLLSDQPATRESSRRQLEQLAQREPVRDSALRALILDSTQRERLREAVDFSYRLLALPQANIQDKIALLDLLRRSNPTNAILLLNETQRQAAHSIPDILALGQWMLRRGQAPAVLAWLESLPATTRTNQPLPLLMTEAHLATRNYPFLSTWLASQTWGETDFLRFAFLAYAKRQAAESLAAKAAWSKSLQATERRLERLSRLAQLVAQWEWPEETEETLWTIVRQFPKEQWAYQLLQRWLYVNGKTQSLETLFAKRLEAEPHNASAKNNLAMVSFLRNAQLDRAHQLALEVYQADPDNPHFVSTYAFSLFLKNEKAKSLKLMDGLQTNHLSIPSIAVYYSYLHSDEANAAKIRPYLEIAEKARLLPEEKALLNKARERLPANS